MGIKGISPFKTTFRSTFSPSEGSTLMLGTGNSFYVGVKEEWGHTPSRAFSEKRKRARKLVAR